MTRDVHDEQQLEEEYRAMAADTEEAREWIVTVPEDG